MCYDIDIKDVFLVKDNSRAQMAVPNKHVTPGGFFWNLMLNMKLELVGKKYDKVM